MTISEVAESDWATAWKKYYHPVRVTRFNDCAKLGSLSRTR